MEGFQSEFEFRRKSSDGDTDVKQLKVLDSEKVHATTTDCHHLSESTDDEENESSDEDESISILEKKNLFSTTLKDDLASLLNDRLFCDIKLQADTETFPAHRNILSARSPVFKEMFTVDKKGQNGECVSVPDISSDTMRRMLQFLYSDFTGSLGMQSAKDLYIASLKYDITSLKKCCSSFMTNNLCISNVCEVLAFAHVYKDKDLESAAQEFVLACYKEVLASDEWKLFMKNYSNLAAHVMYLKGLKD